MYLGNFIKNIGKKYSKLEFSGIAFDSRKVKKNYIFFAINGNKLNGYDYIADAINNGAKIIISEKSIKLNIKNITSIISKNPRKLLSELTYKFLIKKPKKLVAVTGTNGKSSVSDFYYQILSLNKKKSASIGTIGVQFENKKKGISNTTLDPIKLKELINYLLKKNINNLEIIKAMMPGGSVIGCPKINTLNLLNTQEKENRNIYTGSFGYIKFNGDMRFNIIIRSILNFKNISEISVASGVVVDSNANHEFNENFLKAKALIDLFK